jgi:hypothetical protein
MSWLKNKIRRWLDSDQNHLVVPVSPRQSTRINDGLNSEPLRLNVFRANGGTIVETNSYDRKTDRNSTQLHIITHDIDLGQGISKIITMESLRG